MTQTLKIKIARIMILLSIIIIFVGFYFDQKNNIKLIDPKKDTYIVSNSKDSISITTNDGTQITPDSTKDEKNQDAQGEKNQDTQKDNNKTIPNTNSGSSGNTQVEQQPSVQLDANQILRNNIQSKYGITVKYGNETSGYSVGGLNTIVLTDTNYISQILTSLSSSLSSYPTNFFAEIKNAGYPLTLYLIKRYSTNNVTGVTDSTNNNVVISLATDYDFTESLHHEIYHYIEKYLYIKGARYTTWNNLNPQGFSYGNQNSSLSYNITNSSDAYFVNNYAQTAADEDRASTFEYMTSSYKSSCLEQGKPIWLKAKYMCEQIEAVFSSVSPNTIEFWERYVY